MITDRAVVGGWFRETISETLAMRRKARRVIALALAVALAPAIPASARESAATRVASSVSASPTATATPVPHSHKGDHRLSHAGSKIPAGSADSREVKAAQRGQSGANANGGENASPFGSFGGSNRGPVNIQSDSLSLDYKQTTTTFIGHVHATQADGVLTADKLIVKHGKDFNDVQRMTAEGDVRISQGLRWCTSDQAVLNQAAHTVVLTGSPVCHDANDQIAGAKITVHLDSGKSEVEGVKALIFPQESKTRDNEASSDHMK